MLDYPPFLVLGFNTINELSIKRRAKNFIWTCSGADEVENPVLITTLTYFLANDFLFETHRFLGLRSKKNHESFPLLQLLLIILLLTFRSAVMKVKTEDIINEIHMLDIKPFRTFIKQNITGKIMNNSMKILFEIFK